MPIAKLNRSVIQISGENAADWLDKLVTNSLKSEINFAALLTPQGKIIADFFVSFKGDALLIDTPSKFLDDLFKRLKMYRLRAPIEITPLPDMSVYAIWDGEGMEGHEDPRHGSLGRRLITDAHLDDTGDYNANRLSLGVVDSHWDFETTAMFPADVNMDIMNGVDFKKGCFIGQEVVSRMKRMTTVKKRVRGIVLSGPAKAGDKVMMGTRVIGDILSAHDTMAMGLIRLDRWQAGEHSPTVNDAGAAIMGGVDGSR